MADDDQVLLQANDGTEFRVEVGMIRRMSNTVANLIEDAGIDAPIPLPNVATNILIKVIEWAKYHHQNDPAVAAPQPTVDNPSILHISDWDRTFFDSLPSQAVLFELVLAANYLDMRVLLDTTCKIVAGQIKGKTGPEICKHFGITEPFTAEEKERVERENEWLSK